MGLKRKTLKMGKREPWIGAEHVRPLTAFLGDQAGRFKKRKKGRETKRVPTPRAETCWLSR